MVAVAAVTDENVVADVMACVAVAAGAAAVVAVADMDVVIAVAVGAVLAVAADREECDKKRINHFSTVIHFSTRQKLNQEQSLVLDTQKKTQSTPDSSHPLTRLVNKSPISNFTAKKDYR